MVKFYISPVLISISVFYKKTGVDLWMIIFRAISAIFSMVLWADRQQKSRSFKNGSSPAAIRKPTNCLRTERTVRQSKRAVT